MVTVSSFGIKSMALNMKADWSKAREVDEQHESQQQRRVNSWCKLPEQWIKINTDAACHVNGEMTGLGCVARDDTGRFIRARSNQSINESHHQMTNKGEHPNETEEQYIIVQRRGWMSHFIPPHLPPRLHVGPNSAAT